MRTYEELQEEITMLEEQGKVIRTTTSDFTEDKDYKALQSRISFLSKCAKYLSDDPREEFVQKMLEDTESKIQSLNAGFGRWQKNHPEFEKLHESELQKEFDKEMGMRSLKTQLKYLRFILSNKHHVIEYNDKRVVIDYVANKKEEFKVACQRIVDNGASGIVICPDGKRFSVSKDSKKAKLIAA